MRALFFVPFLLLTGCATGAIVEPGHRGLLFNPRAGGVKQEVLGPGYHALDSCTFRSVCSRVDDFDVTYSTKHEEIHTTSAEGLTMDLHIAVIFRPVVTELYELDTEIGANYYDEVIGPEFRSAARGVFARHPYTELQKKNEEIENEIEAELRRRTQGKHVEVASVTMEEVIYAPDIARAVQAKLVGEQEAVRQKVAMENDALRRKLELEQAAVQNKLKAEAELLAKRHEREVAVEQAAIDKVKTEAEASRSITTAKAEAETRILLAKASKEEKKAETTALTPLAVMMHAYDALAKLGGEGTTIFLGDFAKSPQFLFPGSGMFHAAMAGGGGGGGANRPSLQK